MKQQCSKFLFSLVRDVAKVPKKKDTVQPVKDFHLEAPKEDISSLQI